MPITIKRRGEYRLCHASRHDKILLLNMAEAYFWQHTAKGEYITQPEEDTDMGEVLQAGRYFIIVPRSESGWRSNTQHILLEQPDGRYRSYRLEYGLPEDEKQRMRIEDASYVVDLDRITRAAEVSP